MKKAKLKKKSSVTVEQKIIYKIIALNDHIAEPCEHEFKSEQEAIEAVEHNLKIMAKKDKSQYCFDMVILPVRRFETKKVTV